MPVVAAAPEKITPLIKRLRVSFEFTDIAPFFVVVGCMSDPWSTCVVTTFIATVEAISFRPKKQLLKLAPNVAKAGNTGVSE